MRILIPVDGSKHAMAAVQFVASRSTLVGAEPEIELLNVQAPVPARAARVVGKAVCASYYEDEADKALRPALRVLDKAGFAASARHAVGHAAEVIAEATEKPKGRKGAAVDLLVMGSHGRGAMMGLLLGSVTTGVLARTRTPILLLRPGAAPENEALKVGVAVDGSAYGLAAARYVIKHRDLFGATPVVQLIHVVPDFLGATMPDLAGVSLPAFTPDEIAAMQTQAFEAAVAPVRKLFAQAGLPVEEVRLTGNPGDAMSAHAKKKKLDVLVIGSHGHGAFRQAVLGSVATRVAAHCATPLLLVRSA
jgi:nucleotide-binding universal stress UspA family protein